MSRRGWVLFDGRKAGALRETADGMEFEYAPEWLCRRDAVPVSLTLPLRPEPYASRGPHPFFAGLLPEGWLFNLALGALKLAPDDWFGHMLVLCRDCAGAVSVVPEDEWTEPA